ncbi:MAG: hypothetical protein AB1297_02310 [bacterium]
MKVNRFRTLGKKKFQLGKFERELQDNRKQPQIETKDIARAIREKFGLF